MDQISIIGANKNNLKNISLDLPRNQFIVITGPSGSGKSTLAFETLYQEGQKKYLEGITNSNSKFLKIPLDNQVEQIKGLSPTIAVDQKTTITNPRSTVGTVTEIYDFVRILFSKFGTAYSPETQKPIGAQSIDQIVSRILSLKLPTKSKVVVLSPVATRKKGDLSPILDKYNSQGFSKVRLNGQFCEIDDLVSYNKNQYNNLEIVIDRMILDSSKSERLRKSIDLSFKISNSSILNFNAKRDVFYSTKNYCKESDTSFPDLSPSLFSYNSPLGQCKSCQGTGQQTKPYLDEVFLEDLPIKKSSLYLLASKNKALLKLLNEVLIEEGISLNDVICDIPKRVQKILLNGSNKKFEIKIGRSVFELAFQGLNQFLKELIKQDSLTVNSVLGSRFFQIGNCSDCQGMRLNPFALGVHYNSISLENFLQLEVCDLYSKLVKVKIPKTETGAIEFKVLKEVVGRLKFLNELGLGYLDLNRAAKTLSGGEFQRIRIASQLGSQISGVIYVLDEPSIGLHPFDNKNLLKNLIKLRDEGNTVVVVEHDEETIRKADWLVDIGPDSGKKGGQIVFQGKISDNLKSKKSKVAKSNSSKELESTTLSYLSDNCRTSSKNRKPTDFFKAHKIKRHNLNLDSIEVPLGVLTCITGMSGSGKSTLVHDIIYQGIKSQLKGIPPQFFSKLTNCDSITDIVNIDQKPIGRSPKSNPATFCEVYTLIRDVFSQTREAQRQGLGPSYFSFNVAKGRCETCEGNGVLKHEISFLDDVSSICPECNGKRFKSGILNIRYKGITIADVLGLSVGEALDFFRTNRRITRKLSTLKQVGLDYLTLGQSALTLSGGEAQRLKLARELSKLKKKGTLYIFDEPTTGLHGKDVQVLMKAIQELVDLGNSVLIIEHNIDVIKQSDYIIDMGPQGGKNGGQVVAQGPVEIIKKAKKSLTGQFL